MVNMAYTDFQDFLHRLEREGELKRIDVPVDPYLEITEVSDRVMKMPDGGPALLFENPTGKNFPLAINVFGSRKRMSMALGVADMEDIACEIEEPAETRSARRRPARRGQRVSAEDCNPAQRCRRAMTRGADAARKLL